MITSESLISNISYTNKDFNSIYPALLDLVKKITYRWDPSISNESDPGVILLKLNALIADKCNYNIDKNVLECFPMSVTQDRNARQLYAQLGYFMHWRLAAETTITMRWIGDTGTNTYVLPKFTMVADANNNVVYTIVDETITLPLDGSYAQYNAMQGIATNYTVNGNTIITAENLDSNNRLYFDYNDVAENGIFIKNTGTSNYTDWVKVDNLLVQEVSSTSKYYSFGVTQDTNVCYIEFPENAQEIIGGGIEITYLKTDGGYGNVASFTLDKFYDNVTVNNGQIILDSSNVQIINYVPGIGGEDPETIDSAYKNYKRTIGTFDTLVTLRDYTNAIINYQNVSNAVVCDRTNDIQCCYDILSVVNGVNQPVVAMDSNIPLNPFDIKFYMLFDYSEAVTDAMTGPRFNQTFKLLDEVDYESVDNQGNFTSFYRDEAFDYINELKHISHNYSTVTAKDSNNDFIYADRLCFIKNYYPLSGTIIPQYKLPVEQKEEVRENVKTALFDAFNAQQVEFGKEIDYDTVYNVIINADRRIKSVRLNDLTYQTYAVYMWVNSQNKPIFKEVRIDVLDDNSNHADDTDITNGFDYGVVSDRLRKEIAAKSVLAGVTPLCVADENISPQIGQTYSQINGDYLFDAKYMTTALDKTNDDDGFIKNTTDKTFTYVVADNESVSLFAPNLIDTDAYTSYVRYEYMLQNDVLPNTSYALGSGEYVAFYWSADINSGYNYAAYGSGQIIKSTFLMEAASSGSLLQAMITEIDNSSDHKISGVTYTSSIPGIEAHIMSLPPTDILSSTKTITIQSTNEVELDSTNYYCSWILDEVNEDNEYVLFEAGQASYQLKTGEYFLYTNSTRTSLVILGSGTLLSRDISTWSEEWACAAYKYSSIVSDGMDTLVNTPNALQRVKVGCILNVTEQQFITLNNGATLVFTYTNNVPSPEPLIKTIGGYSYDITSNDFSGIKYKGKDEDTFVLVPMVNINSNTWTLKSQLNINMSKEHPQELTSGQFITVIDAGGTASSPITEAFVASSFDISKEGGDNVDVRRYDSDKEIWETPKISTFTMATSTTYIAYTSSGVTSLQFIEGSHEVQQLDMGLPADDYIIVLQHGNENLSELYVKDANGNYIPKFGDENNASIDNTYLKNPGTYYLKMTSSTVQPLTVYCVPAAGSDAIVMIQECLKYSIYDGISDITTADLVAEVKSLDQNFLFDFSYQVSQDEKIDDPLNSMSFFEATHPFNKCTIGQLDTESLGNIYISEKTRS